MFYHVTCSQNMWKVIFDNMWKVWKNRTFQGQFLHISREAVIHAILRTWKKWIPIVCKSVEKRKHYIIMCFLNISREAKIHTITRTWKKWIPIVRKIMGKHKYSKSMSFLHIPRETETNTFPETWKKWILIERETYVKTQTLQSYGSVTYFMWSINSYNSQ